MESTKHSNYYVNKDGKYIIEDFNRATPFSSFLPAIAGLHGKPLWAYYVNRGQCISSMGINEKSQQIMEFFAANAAYRETPLQGFRTFLKITKTCTGETICYEPFQNRSLGRQYDIQQNMEITSHDLTIMDINQSLGLKIEVNYCTLPNEAFSSFIRTVVITNISEQDMDIEVLDGLPAIIPYCDVDYGFKSMSHSRQAFMRVHHYDSIPLYKLDHHPFEVPEIVKVEGGYFYINMCFDDHGKAVLSKVIVDPELVFGSVTDLTLPESFFRADFQFPQSQVNFGKLPCGFGHRKIVLPKGVSNKNYSMIGFIEKYEEITTFTNTVLSEEYLTRKITENKTLIDNLKNPIYTSSSSPAFDQYCGQTFLDNILRGGYPVAIGKGKHIFYVYSRKHGDLERDYNNFQVDASYYSQGNANFRDINQNRRNDTFFFPFVSEANIITFFNFLRLDGFNPFVLKGIRFYIEDTGKVKDLTFNYMNEDSSKQLLEYLQKPYTPGALLQKLESWGLNLEDGTAEEILNQIVSFSVKEDLGEHAEGFWTDHWTYNTDLVEQYRAIYPDSIMELLFEKVEFTYYDDAIVVLPRDKKYVLTSEGVRQFGSLAKNEEKERILKSRQKDPNKVRASLGKGEIYRCTLISKILCLLLNKVASLDAQGIGVEMEANKPGWCDSLNGLPGYMGSSINESAEIKRLTLLLLDILESYQVDKNFKIMMPEEVYNFFVSICGLLGDDMDDYTFWNSSWLVKEKFRKATEFGISGGEKGIDVNTLIFFLKAVNKKIDIGIEKAYCAERGMYYTYFLNTAEKYEVITCDNSNIPVKNKDGYSCVRVTKFIQKPVPFFLEGNARILKVIENKEKARQLYQTIRKSGLYDEKLGMYKINESIPESTGMLGKHSMFPAGCRENESIFLHLEYKYLLEILKSGLYEEFFEDFRKVLIPFHDPHAYGRSILENSSFLISSVYSDEKVHGRGYCPRLTGTSAELLSLWLYMTAGEKPFFLNSEGELCLEFRPVLPGWLFTEEEREDISIPANTFAFNFLGNILVIYHNKSRKNTFGEESVKISRIVLKLGDKTVNLSSGVISSPYAAKVREGEVDRIDIWLE